MAMVSNLLRSCKTNEIEVNKLATKQTVAHFRSNWLIAFKGDASVGILGSYNRRFSGGSNEHLNKRICFHLLRWAVDVRSALELSVVCSLIKFI